MAGGPKRGDSSEQERSMRLDPTKRGLALGQLIRGAVCLLGQGPGVPQHPRKTHLSLDCPLSIEKLKKSKEPERFVYKHYLMSLVKVPPKGNCISTLKGFLNYF